MFKAACYGMILSLGLIIPLGMQNIYIFNQGANHDNYLKALPSVMTAALCDAILIILAILGVSMTVLTIPWLKIIVLAIGVLFLLYMGWSMWQSTGMRNYNTEPLSAKRQILFSTSVSLLNPHALLDTVGVIGTNAVNFMGREKLVYGLACIIVSCMWFFALSVTGHYCNHFLIRNNLISKLNKISAVIMWSVAIYILIWQIIFHP